MTHLKIEQNNGITEQVSPSVIEKLYEIVHSGNLDSSSNLMGSLNTTGTYLNYVDYLEELFTKDGVRLLVITANKLYISFEDPAVLRVLVSRFGDGTGVTISNLSSVSLLPAGIFDYNTTIETFNELGLFTNITSMSYDCFRGCTNLRSIDLSNILEFSSGNALNRCSKLGSDNNGILNLPKLNSILGGSCLASCTSLVEVNIGSNVSSGNKISLIKNSTFSDCTNLEKVTGLSEVTSLEGGVFYSCQKLKNLPDLNNSTVLSIGDECFFNCFALKCIDLTSLTISFVGKNHFYRCRNLIDLSTNDYTQASSAAATYTFNWSTVPRGIFWQAAITNKSFNFPNATSIGEHAFDSSGIVGITSPNVISIDSNAFSDCTSLTTVDLSNVTTIGAYAFYGCSVLTSVGDLSNITTIRYQAFCGCSSLSTIGLSNVLIIESTAFENCTSLTSIDLNSCTDILGASFKGCTGLTTVNNLSLTTIKASNFNGCSSLTTIDLSGVVTVEGRAFLNCSGLTSLDLSSCTSIEFLAFAGCANVQTITLNNNLTTLPLQTFSYCIALTTINADHIEDLSAGEAFLSCTSLTTIDISSCTNIGNRTFSGCSALTTVKLGSNLTTIGSNIFLSCYALTTIQVPSAKLSDYQTLLPGYASLMVTY